MVTSTGRRRDELVERFSEWSERHAGSADPGDVELLLDWRSGYGDGELETWTVGDVAEFLLTWCPRKYSARPEDCAALPRSVSAFVDFLAHSGRLSARSDPPSRIRGWCTDNTGRFLREMADPANHGMAKNLLGGLRTGAVDGADVLGDLMQRFGPAGSGADATAPDGVGAGPDGGPLRSVGPVRIPSDDERRHAAGRATTPLRVRELAGFCAAPGRGLTAKGNLRLADARHLVQALGTGDPVRSVRSAEDLPVLDRLVQVALAAGAVRRHRGRLVAVARFAALDDVAAFDAVAAAAVSSLQVGHAMGWFLPALEQVREFAAECVPLLLARVVDGAGAGEGVPDAELTELLRALIVTAFPGAGVGLATFMLPSWSEQVIGELVDLGLVTLDPGTEPCPDCAEPHATVTLTAAGTPAVVALVRSVGVDVTERPDPATAGADDMADLIEHLDTDAWSADVEAWLAARPDAGAAARQLVAAVATPDRDTLFVMSGLQTLGDLAGDAVVDAARELLGGRHDGIALTWLVGLDVLDPSTVDPRRLLIGSIDLLACALATGEPEAVVEGIDRLAPGEQGALLRDLWRLDHPRVAELLDVLGTHHPSKPVAKEARRSAMKLRSRTR